MSMQITGKLVGVIGAHYEATIELSENEALTLKNCLDYCKHRLKRHPQEAGLLQTGCTLEMVEELINKYFPTPPSPAQGGKIKPLYCAMSNMGVDLKRLETKLNELIAAWNEREGI